MPYRLALPLRLSDTHRLLLTHPENIPDVVDFNDLVKNKNEDAIMEGCGVAASVLLRGSAGLTDDEAKQHTDIL